MVSETHTQSRPGGKGFSPFLLPALTGLASALGSLEERRKGEASAWKVWGSETRVEGSAAALGQLSRVRAPVPPCRRPWLGVYRVSRG